MGIVVFAERMVQFDRKYGLLARNETVTASRGPRRTFTAISRCQLVNGHVWPGNGMERA
uniref:hypothetical protein n=1 Tax=Pseudodesulfovibrio sp. TaxID=2035812 RepID=UPI00257C7A7F|nr:hypothetical protein [Pseudodesulfovibrio sp.]